jgi:hypothetical protein
MAAATIRGGWSLGSRGSPNGRLEPPNGDDACDRGLQVVPNPGKSADTDQRTVSESSGTAFTLWHENRAVIPRPGHTIPGFCPRGCRAEESAVGLLEGGRGSPRRARRRAVAGQGQCRGSRRVTSQGEQIPHTDSQHPLCTRSSTAGFTRRRGGRGGRGEQHAFLRVSAFSASPREIQSVEPGMHSKYAETVSVGPPLDITDDLRVNAL